MAKVIRLYGKADRFDIEFARNDKKWTVDIPPDMTDGVYACQLTAIDENGELGYWVGELYMCSGVCHFKIRELPYRIGVRHRIYDVHFSKGRYMENTSCAVYKTETAAKYVSEMRAREVNASYEAFTQSHLTVSHLSQEKCFDDTTDKVCKVTAKDVFTKIHTNCIIKKGKECGCNV